MAPETLKWLIGGAASSVVVIGGVLGWLMSMVYRLGQSAKTIEQVGKDLLHVRERADKVPIIETKLEQLADAQQAHRAKTDSDIRELRRAVWGRSSPHMNGIGEE